MEEGFRAVRCRYPGCRHIIQEHSEDYWVDCLSEIACVKCGSSGILIAPVQNYDRRDRLYLEFWCETCDEEFEREIHGTRLKCPKCKLVQVRYWFYDLWRFQGVALGCVKPEKISV